MSNHRMKMRRALWPQIILGVVLFVLYVLAILHLGNAGF